MKFDYFLKRTTNLLTDASSDCDFDSVFVVVCAGDGLVLYTLCSVTFCTHCAV